MSNQGSTYGASWATQVLADVLSKENRGGVIPRCYSHLQLDTMITTLYKTTNRLVQCGRLFTSLAISLESTSL